MTPHDHPDARLRQALRQGLAEDARSPETLARSQTLAHRVMAQWQQRQGHSAVPTEVLLGGQAKGLHTRWSRGLVVLSVVAALVWCQRPDPKVDELMQPDVLSQITLDAL